MDQIPFRSEAASNHWVPGPPAPAHRSPAPPRPIHLTVSFAEPKLSASTSTSSALGSGPHSGSSGPHSGRAMLPQANFGPRAQSQLPQHQNQPHQNQQHQMHQQQPQQQQQAAFRGTSQNSAASIERLCQAASRGDIPLLNELLRAGTPLEADKVRDPSPGSWKVLKSGRDVADQRPVLRSLCYFFTLFYTVPFNQNTANSKLITKQPKNRTVVLLYSVYLIRIQNRANIYLSMSIIVIKYHQFLSLIYQKCLIQNHSFIHLNSNQHKFTV